MPVCFTFDIEEHDRIEAAAGLVTSPERRAGYAARMETQTRWLLEALAVVGARATFFIVGEIARCHPGLVRDIAAAGHEVGCHSWDHRRIHRFTPDTFRDDLRRACDALADAAGRAVVGFRAPTFSLMKETAWAVDVLAEEGLRYDSSIFPVRHDRYGVPAAPRRPFVVRGPALAMLELPPATLRLAGYNLPAAGGGYFRLFPPAIMRAAIRRLDPAVLYFHPWEFDADQPRLPLGRASKLRTYVGIRKSRDRLTRLLNRYGSVRMIDVAAKLDLATLLTFDLHADRESLA